MQRSHTYDSRVEVWRHVLAYLQLLEERKASRRSIATSFEAHVPHGGHSVYYDCCDVAIKISKSSYSSPTRAPPPRSSATMRCTMRLMPIMGTRIITSLPATARDRG